MELLVTFVIIFVPIFLSFMCFRTKEKDYIFGYFIFIFIFLHVFHIIVLSILLSENFYKDTIIWKNGDYQYIHSLYINPVKNININEENDIISEDFINLKYTLKKTNIFNKECLKGFFIKEDDCPITDIVSYTEQRNDYKNYTEIKINNNLYLYYSKNFINGTLYSKNDLNNITDLPNNVFNFNEFNKEEKSKEEEVIDAIKDLKYYADYSELICLSLFFVSLFVMIINLIYYSNLYQIINIMIQIILFIFYLIRYIKFIHLKNVFDKYKDFISIQYKNSDSYEYFPEKYFNIDSFALALQINILIIIILYSEIFEGCFIKYDYLRKEINNEIYSMIFCLTLLYTTMIYLIKLLENLSEINYRVDNILNNWNKNPIKSIFLNENIIANINWKNNSLIFDKFYDYNYKNGFSFYLNSSKICGNDTYDIYRDGKICGKDSYDRYKDSKICGKDSYDNDLYFPLDVECPINSIIISENKNFDIKGEYSRLNLKNNYFLYYSNKKINEKIIIDLIISNHNGPELNFYESKEKEKLMDFDIKSYSNIEMFNDKHLLAIHYIGIDSNILSKTKKINIFDDKLKIYKRLIIAIEALLISFYGIILVFCVAFGMIYGFNTDKFFWGFYIIFLIFFIPIIILSSISLSMFYEYVINFLNKINETYENNKINFSWEMMIIIHFIIIIIIFLLNILNCCNEYYFKKLCECGACKTFKCDCDLGECECLKCLKNCGCDCRCICFKCSKNNINNNHIPSERIYINNTETLGEIQSLKNMISNMIRKSDQAFDEVNNIKYDIVKIKSKNKNKSFNNIRNNCDESNDEIKSEISYIKNDIGNIKNLCNNCLEKIGNNNNDIRNNKNEINELKNEIVNMSTNFLEKIGNTNNVLKNNKNEINKIQNEISNIDNNCSNINYVLNNNKNEINKIQNEISNLNNNCSIINNELKNNKNEINGLRNEIYNMSNNCLEKIRNNNEIKDCKNEINKLQNEINNINNNCSKILNNVNEIKNNKNEINKLQNEITNMNINFSKKINEINDVKNNKNEINNLQNEINNIKSNCLKVLNDINEIKNNKNWISKLQDEVINMKNNFLEKIGKNNNDLKNCKNEINELRNGIINMNNNFSKILNDIKETKNNKNEIINMNNNGLEKIGNNNVIKSCINEINKLRNEISNINNKEIIGNNSNDSNEIKNCLNEINKLQKEIIDMKDSFNGEITQLKNNAKYIGRLCEECLEKIKNINNIKEIDNELKIMIKYENKLYQILINKDCTYKDFLSKIYSSISSSLNLNDIQYLILYYWNQFGEKNKIKDDNDFVQVLKFHIFYFEVIYEKQNQINQQNYISNEDY